MPNEEELIEKVNELRSKKFDVAAGRRLWDDKAYTEEEAHELIDAGLYEHGSALNALDADHEEH
jgi:hypothetical protein